MFVLIFMIAPLLSSTFRNIIMFQQCCKYYTLQTELDITWCDKIFHITDGHTDGGFSIYSYILQQ